MTTETEADHSDRQQTGLPGTVTVTEQLPGGTITLPGGGITTRPPGSAPFPGQPTEPGGQGTLTGLPTATSSGSITGPTVAPPTEITSPAGRFFVINLRLYLNGPTDTVLSVTTDPPVPWATLSGSDLSIAAPDVTSEFTLVIRIRAADAAGVPYERVINLKIEPIVLVPVTADNDFSIDLSKYLVSTGDIASISTEPNSPWIQYSRPVQRIAGHVPADYKEPRTLITVSVSSQTGGTYVRYFALVVSPVPVVPLALGGQLALQLTPYLLAPEDIIAATKSNPNATWVEFSPDPKALSGLVPPTLEYQSVIVTVLAKSFTKGLEYSFQLELYIQDSSKPDAGVLVPVVAKNQFSITTSKYFPASVQLSALNTVPQVDWVTFDPAKNTVSGTVPDLAPGTVVKVTVNASSAAAPGSEAATYSKVYNLEVQPNDIPKFQVTLGAQFGIDVGARLLSPPGDYLTSLSTLPPSGWVVLGVNGKTIGGNVPLDLAAGSIIAVAGTAVNPSLDYSYNKDFSLEVLAGENLKIPVLIGTDFQVNLTDYLKSGDDAVEFTTSPPVDWVRRSPTPPPSLIGTVPIDYEGADLNITIIATARSSGLKYTILASLQMFTNQKKVGIFQSDFLTVDLRPLLKAPEDLVESIEKFPNAPWLILDAANKSVSGTVPLDQPAGSSVNITVNGLSLQEPTRSIGRLRGPMRASDLMASELMAIEHRQVDLVYFAYSVLVTVVIFDRPVGSSSSESLSFTIILSTIQPPASTPLQPTGTDGSPSVPIQPTTSGAGVDSTSAGAPATQPSAATFSSKGQVPTSSNRGQEPTGPSPTQSPPKSATRPAETPGPSSNGGPQQPTSSVSGAVSPGPSLQPPSSGGTPPTPTPGLPSLPPSLPPAQSTSPSAVDSQPSSAPVVIPPSSAAQDSSPGPSSLGGFPTLSVAPPIVQSTTNVVLPTTGATSPVVILPTTGATSSSPGGQAATSSQSVSGAPVTSSRGVTTSAAGSPAAPLSSSTSTLSSPSGPFSIAQLIPNPRSGPIFPSPKVLVLALLLYFPLHHSGPDNVIQTSHYILHKPNEYHILKPNSKFL